MTAALGYRKRDMGAHSDYSVERSSIVVASLGELYEVLARLGCMICVELDLK